MVDAYSINVNGIGVHGIGVYSSIGAYDGAGGGSSYIYLFV